MRRALLFFLATALAHLACGRGNPMVLGPTDLRIREAGAAWGRYSPQDQKGMREGITRAGLDELSIYIARGKPTFWWRTQTPEGVCNVLLHAKVNEPELVDRAFYVCNGTISAINAVSPELPCWRLAEVVPRIVEKQTYFEQQPLPRQWELLEGILKRGQSGEDVYIAFGKPYNTGVEAREDGTNASQRVYLDSTGESYGLYITLVDEKVAGWKIPADRQLTPEAQKKRLEATEQRLMSQLKVMEENNVKRHKEQIKLLTDLASRADEIVKNQTAGVATTTGAIADGRDAPGLSVTTTNSVSKSSRTMTLGDCRFNDESGDPEFFKPCDSGGCGNGYACYAYAGTRGRCVPQGQLDRCTKTSTTKQPDPPPPPPAVDPPAPKPSAKPADKPATKPADKPATKPPPKPKPTRKK